MYQYFTYLLCISCQLFGCYHVTITMVDGPGQEKSILWRPDVRIKSILFIRKMDIIRLYTNNYNVNKMLSEYSFYCIFFELHTRM